MDKKEKKPGDLSRDELREITGGTEDDFHWRQCPSCKTWVELDSSGHGTCPTCGYRWA